MAGRLVRKLGCFYLDRHSVMQPSRSETNPCRPADLLVASKCEDGDLGQDFHDNMEWVPEGSASPQTIARSISKATTAKFETGFVADADAMDSDEETDCSLDSPCLPKLGANPAAVPKVETSRSSAPPPRVQVRVRGLWRDVAAEEAREIGERLAEGEAKFQLRIPSGAYEIDFCRVGRAVRRDMVSGKTRRLRILAPRRSKRESQKQQRAPDQLGATERQRSLGPQSQRGHASQYSLSLLEGNQHALRCFEEFAEKERKYCGEWAVFYHSYSHAALIYEVQAAIASVLFGFQSQFAPLPRLLMHDFYDIPDAETLMQQFASNFVKARLDHNTTFRKVALSTMCSLAAEGPEICLANVFSMGYSCKDVPFRSILENLLESCSIPRKRAVGLASEIVALAEGHGLDTMQFGGRRCGSGKTGHVLQVFVRRPLVDRLSYAARPYGYVDKERMPLSQWLNGDNPNTRGQARLVAHPEHFMQAGHVRMHVASADPTFHDRRGAFQQDLRALLEELREPAMRESATAGIYGGVLPPWWAASQRRSQRRA